jgi:ABC-type sugar transport system substrate-binding protein
MKDGVLNIRSGKQHATATQIPTEEAEVAAKKIAAHFGGRAMQKYELVPVHGITRENLDKFAAGCSY